MNDIGSAIRRFNRFELKYILPFEAAGSFRHELGAYLKPDSYGDGDGSYTVSSLTDEVAQAMNLPAGTEGAPIISVAQGSPADEAGLRGSQDVLTTAGQEYPYGGDIITAIQGKSVADMDDLITYLVENTRPGDQVTLGLLRAEGEKEDVTARLGARPSN